MTVESRSRVSRAFLVFAVALSCGALAFACADNKRILGDDCIKDDDCQSGICTDLRCTAAPPILDRDATPPHPDAGPDVGTDAGDGGDGSTSDGSADSAPDATAD